MIYYFSGGAYSDYSVEGIYEGDSGLDFNKLAADYKRDCPDEWVHNETLIRGNSYVDFDKFFSYLVKRGVLKAVKSKEVHLARVVKGTKIVDY